MVKIFTDQNFKQDVMNVAGVVLIDFWAPWCAPCRIQSPIVDELSRLFADQKNLTVGKMNVDENPAVAQEHQIFSIPTIKIFKAGEVIEELIGLQTKDSLVRRLRAHLGL